MGRECDRDERKDVDHRLCNDDDVGEDVLLKGVNRHNMSLVLREDDVSMQHNTQEGD